MKLTAALLVLVLPTVASVEGTAPTPGPMASLIAPVPAPRQDWFGAPVVPEIFRTEDSPEEPPPLEDLLPQDRPKPAPPLGEPSSPEQSWGKGLTALDLQAWQQEDDLRIIREWAGDALLGLPLLVPQLVLEAALPRGFKVGPTTFLYRTSPASSSLVLVVLDQMLFHEAEFLSRVQEYADDRYSPDDLTRGQRKLLRRSLMTGLRATYDIPGVTMGLVIQTAADHGSVGALLVPPVCGAILYFKGIEQKFQIDDTLKVRFKLASGREWVRGVGSDDGVPTFSIEVKFRDLPVGILGSFELSSRGMMPAFIGIGTTLDVVEELLGREADRFTRPD